MYAANFTGAQLDRLRVAWWLLEQVFALRARHTAVVAIEVRRSQVSGIGFRGCTWGVLGPRVIALQDDPEELNLPELAQFFSHEGKHVRIGPSGRFIRVDHDCEPHFCDDAEELAMLQAWAEANSDFIRENFGQEIHGATSGLKVVGNVLSGAAVGLGLGLLLSVVVDAF